MARIVSKCCMYVYTVEPPNNGHFWNGHFVLFSEAVPISEACHCLTVASFNSV